MLKIAGVVVLYNPSESIINNIKTYLPQIEKLFVVDNSDLPNDIEAKLNISDKKINYIFNNGNVGIASALNIGLNSAIVEGFQFLLTMDQDSYFEDQQLNNLICKLDETEPIGIYSPFHKNKFNTNLPKTDDLEEVSDVMTSGNIIDLSAASKVGKFNEEYFIDYVDIEYCLRMRKNGYKIVRVNNSILNHNEADLSRRKFLGRFVYPPNHYPIRWYYKIRNYNYLKKEYFSVFKEYFKVEKKNIRNNIIKVLLFEKKKVKKVKMMIIGYIHFLKNIFGSYPS